MSLPRFLSRFLLTVGILLAAVFLIGISPPFQAWLARSRFEAATGATANFGTFWAGFGKLTADDIQITGKTYSFNAPSLSAKLPLLQTIRKHELHLRRLEAKGWTLDLRPPEIPSEASTVDVDAPAKPEGKGSPEASTTAAKAETVESPFAGSSAFETVRTVLERAELPFDLSADDVDLEGDVIFNRAGGTPAKVHLSLRGTGLRQGSDGSFSLQTESATLSAENKPIYANTKGTAILRLATPRRLEKVQFEGQLTATGGALPHPIDGSLGFTAAHTSAGTTLRFAFKREGHDVVAVSLQPSQDTSRLEGSWKAEIAADDLPLLSSLPLPFVRACAGEGVFTSDASFSDLHASGSLAAATRLPARVPAVLQAESESFLTANFDLVRNAAGVRLDRLELQVGRDEPTANLQLLQPLQIGPEGKLEVKETAAELWRLVLRAHPLASIPVGLGGWELTGARASGELFLRQEGSDLMVRSTRPVVVSAGSLQQGTRVLDENLGADFAIEARLAEKVSTWDFPSFALTRASSSLSNLAVKVTSPADAKKPSSVEIRGTVDLASLSEKLEVTALKRSGAKTAVLDLNFQPGPSPKWTGNIQLSGDGGNTLSASKLDLGWDAKRGLTFRVPAKVTWSGKNSDLLVEGTWYPSRRDNNLIFSLTGAETDTAFLRALALPLVPELGQTSGTSAVPDAIPFWSPLSGRLTYRFDKVSHDEESFKDVRGVIEIQPASLHLNHGEYALFNNTIVPLEGDLSFNSGTPEPYVLKLGFASTQIDASSFFGKPGAGEEPLFDGKLSITSRVDGRGRTLADLLARAEEQVSLAGKNGILRFLKTRITFAQPESGNRMVEGVANFGTAIGTFFGRRDRTGKNSVQLPKKTQAVMDFSFELAELGYGELSVTARRQSDGRVLLDKMEAVGATFRLSATGSLMPTPSGSLGAGTLDLQLKLGVSGRAADLLAQTGIARSEKDADGFTWMEQPVHIAGTPRSPDLSAWHDRLTQAAVPDQAPSVAPKK